MSIRAALEKLHQQGRIARPWLPGMKCIGPWGAGGPVDPFASWTVGWLRFSDSDLGLAWPADSEPDPEDPATASCLLALAQEAMCDATIHARPGWGEDDDDREYRICTWNAEWQSSEDLCVYHGQIMTMGSVIHAASPGAVAGRLLVAMLARWGEP